MQTTSNSKDTNLRHYNFAGRHLLASYFGCDESVINDPRRCLEALRMAAAASKVTVVSENVHHFPNGAVTAILLLAESHASIHTYPEHRSCFVDFFTCGLGDAAAFDKVLQNELKPTSAEVQIAERGNKEDHGTK